MAPKTAPIHLPGTTLEGGGQLLRIALCLSALTTTPITITKIRGNRSGGGGLKAQHLTSLSWLGQASNARISGAGLKSKEITFTPAASNPKSSKKQDLRNDTQISYLQSLNSEIRIHQSTPGSTSLILQAILPYILFSGHATPIHLTITGGTNVSNSPSHEYITHVLLPMLSLIGIPRITTTLHTRGWSQGSTCIGRVSYTVSPLINPLPAFHLTSRGEVVSIDAYILAPHDTQQDWHLHLTHTFLHLPSSILTNITFSPSHHEKRYYLLLVATSSTGLKLGRDWLYDIAIRPSNHSAHAKIVPSMVKKVMADLDAEIGHGGCVDEYMRDQMVVFQALAGRRSVVYGGKMKEGVDVVASLHARTGMWVCKEMLGVEFDEDGGCEGIGYQPCGAKHEDGVGEEVLEAVAKLEV